MKNKHTTLAMKRHTFGRVFIRNLLLLTCLTLVPMLLMVWIATFSQRAFVEKEITLYNSRTVSLLQNSMNGLVSSSLQQANYLLTENDIDQFLITPEADTPFITMTSSIS